MVFAQIYDRYFGATGFSAFSQTSKQWRVQIEPPFDSAGNSHATARWFDYEDRIVDEYTGVIVAPNGGAWSNGPDLEVHHFSYDKDGNKKTYTDPRGRQTIYDYNLRNLQTQSTEYPLSGETPSDPRVTATSFDTAGNKRQVTFPDLQTQQWTDYDAFGQPGTFTDERGDHTELTYVWGPMKKLYKVTTHRTRDDGNPEPQLTTFSYDLMGKPTQVLFPDLSHEDYTYECVTQIGYQCDQPNTFTTRKGQTKKISYDARGRVIKETWTGDSPAPEISRAWDDANRVTSLCNIYSTVSFGYDGGGMMLYEGDTITGSNGGTGGYVQITYHRYGNGKVSDIGYPDGVWVHRDYIGRGQLKTVSDSLNSQPFQTVIDYTYLPDGKVDHADYRNGVRCVYGYDGRGMIKTVDHSRAGSQQDLSRREYTRDSRDRIISFKKGTSGYNPMENGRGDRFRYDDEGQLVEAWYNAADPANSGAGNNRYDGFSYDELGNRENRVGSNFVASRGPTSFYRRDTGLNEYASWTPSALWYDGGGVMGQDGWITLPVNSLNQPIWAWAPAYAGTSTLMWFGYDPLGRCVKRWVSASGSEGTNPATYLYYEGWNLIQEGPSYNSASRNYIHGARVDEVVKQITPTNWWERYFHYDARGHCTLQTDASGNIAEQYEYDAFGYPYFFDGAGNPIGSYAAHGVLRGYSPWGNRFLCTGREYLSELALYDYRNRMYQPELGRFLQPDPKEFAAGDYNLYRYCHNDPVNKNDPMGLYVTYDDKWSQKDAENFNKEFERQWNTPEGRQTWEARYNSTDEFRISPDRSTGSPERGAATFNIDKYPARTFLQSLGDALKRDANWLVGNGQSNENFEKMRKGDNTAANQQAHQAAREGGLTTKDQLRQFHNADKSGMSYQDMVKLAEEIKAGNYH
jgi:RHS repeat-associated protein